MIGTKGISAAIFAACLIAGGDANAACALAEGAGTGYSIGHASQLARMDALGKAGGAQGAQVEYSQPACYHLDNRNAGADMVRCTMTVSWCTNPAVPRSTVGVPEQRSGPPGTIGIPEPEYRRPLPGGDIGIPEREYRRALPRTRIGIPEPEYRQALPRTGIGIPERQYRGPLPPQGGGRSCNRLDSMATASTLSQARKTAYRAITRALQARGTAAGVPGVVLNEPTCLQAGGRNGVTCTMSATYCR